LRYLAPEGEDHLVDTLSAHLDQTVLQISNVVLKMGIDVAEAIAALAAEISLFMSG